VALSSSGGAIIEKLFGLKDDVPFTADMDGDGCSEMVVLRPGFWFWYSTKLFGSAVTQVQWGLQGDYPLTPQDMNGDGNADYIISRISGSQQQVYVRYSDNSNTSTTYNIPSTAIPMTGRFVSSSQSSLAFWNRSTGLLSFVQGDNSLSSVAFGISVNAVVRPDGTVVQPTQTARVPETGTGSTGGGSSGGDSGGGNDGPPSAGLSAVCSTIVPFSAGSLWKPSSQDTNDAREGRPVILYNRNIPTGYSCLKVYAKNGEAISQLGVYEYSGRYGGRWYTGRGCGDLKTGSQIASTAQSKTGSVSVYVQRQPGVCVGPFDPRNRNGSLA
jgi:hypothetical protein